MLLTLFCEFSSLELCAEEVHIDGYLPKLLLDGAKEHSCQGHTSQIIAYFRDFFLAFEIIFSIEVQWN